MSGQFRGQQVGDRVGTTERLEATEVEAGTLVLDTYFGHVGDVGQNQQRGWGIVWPTGDRGFGALEARGGQDGDAGDAVPGVDQ